MARMILVLLLVIGAGFVPIFIRRLQARARKKLLARQLREALSLMVHALRVGVSFQQALRYAAQEGAEPLAAEWRRVMHAVEIGRPLGEALNDLPERVPVHAMRWFVAAVQITQNTGGSLAEVLGALAETLQDRETLRDKVDALTAQGKASGILLSLLPFIVMAALWVIVPGMAAPMFTTLIGQMLLAAVVVLVTLGGLVIRRIVTIEVE